MYIENRFKCVCVCGHARVWGFLMQGWVSYTLPFRIHFGVWVWLILGSVMTRNWTLIMKVSSLQKHIRVNTMEKGGTRSVWWSLLEWQVLYVTLWTSPYRLTEELNLHTLDWELVLRKSRMTSSCCTIPGWVWLQWLGRRTSGGCVSHCGPCHLHWNVILKGKRRIMEIQKYFTMQKYT